MHRFFVDKTREKDGIAIITGEDAKHLEKVLRLTIGDLIEVVVEEEREYLGEIMALEKQGHRVRLLELRSQKRESPLKITLYQGLPKSTKLELIIQKAVELGVYRIVPVMNRRSVVQLKSKKDQLKKQERWQKIAYEAAKQSKRVIIPEVTLPVEFNPAVENAFEEGQIVAYEEENKAKLRSITLIEKHLKTADSSSSIGLWVGPEGGFALEEIEALRKIGADTVSLGPRILRTETAGVALITMLQYEIGDLGG